MKKQKTTSGLFLMRRIWEERKSEDKSEMRKIAKEQTIKYNGGLWCDKFKIKLFLNWWLLSIVRHVKVNFKDIVDSDPEHHNKVNIALKSALKWITFFFGFPVHIKVILMLYYNLLSVQEDYSLNIMYAMLC